MRLEVCLKMSFMLLLNTPLPTTNTLKYRSYFQSQLIRVKYDGLVAPGTALIITQFIQLYLFKSRYYACHDVHICLHKNRILACLITVSFILTSELVLRQTRYSNRGEQISGNTSVD